jgi:hypothetical protein
MIQIYACEKCGEQFKRLIDCEHHEFKCINMEDRQRKELEIVKKKLLGKYGDLIKDIRVKVDTYFFYSDYDEGMHDVIKFELDIDLKNGNKVIISDGMISLGNFANSEQIFKEAEKEIHNGMSTTYEGVIYTNEEDGWYVHYIGDVEISDIVQRLYGRKVRLEVIE